MPKHRRRHPSEAHRHPFADHRSGLRGFDRADWSYREVNWTGQPFRQEVEAGQPAPAQDLPEQPVAVADMQ